MMMKKKKKEFIYVHTQSDVSSVCFSFHKRSIQNFSGSVYFLLLKSLQQNFVFYALNVTMVIFFPGPQHPQPAACGPSVSAE
jgi:hypothetical protein